MQEINPTTNKKKLKKIVQKSEKSLNVSHTVWAFFKLLLLRALHFRPRDVRGGVSGGYQALFENWASGMFPIEFWHIFGCLAFSDFFCSPKNKPYPGQITFGKYKTIHFFFLNSNYIKPNLKTAFGISLDLGKCPNQKTCTLMRFLVRGLPEVQN